MILKRPALYQVWLLPVAIMLMTVVLEITLLSGAQDFIDSKLTEQEAAVRSEAQATTLAVRESMVHLFDQIDALHSLARLVTLSRHADNTATANLAEAELSIWRDRMHSGVQQVGGIGLDGRVIWTNILPDSSNIYLGDQEHFRAIVSGANDFVGRPVVGRITGQQSIEFIKAIRTPDATLTGMTVVSVDPDRLTRTAAAIDIAPTDIITILRRDGVILARRGSDGWGVSALPANSPWLEAFLDSASGAGPAPRAIDGLDRIVAWQRIDDLGLIIAVGLDRATRLQRWYPTLLRMQRLEGFAATLVGVLGLWSAAFVLWRQRMAKAAARVAMLQENDGLFRQLADSLPDLIRLLEPDGSVIYANEAARELLGVDPADLTRRSAYQFVHPDDLPKIAFPGLAALPLGTRRRSEVRIIRPDGQTIWVQSNLRTIDGRWLNRNSMMIVSATRDVTAQHEAENVLRRTKEELDAVLATTRSVIYRGRIDADGTGYALFVSDSAHQLIGYTPDEIKADPTWIHKQLDPAFAGAHRAHLQRLMVEGSSRLKYRLRHRDGHWLWVAAFSRRIEGEGLTMVGTITDVTREHEQEVHLAQSNKMALLGEMTTGMAHELNQPLTAIGMMAENGLSLIEEGAPPEAVAAKLDRIREQVKRAAALVNHMRVFGRKPDNLPAPVLVPAVIDGALSVLATRLNEASIAVTVAIDGDLPPVIGHLVLLEQVLVNLLANAADAIEARQPPLPADRRTIEVRAGFASGMVDINVADHGGGIDPDILARLFEPFFTTKAVGRGTGLGLSICYGIVSDMGGVISARNEGDGSVFQVRLSPA